MSNNVMIAALVALIIGGVGGYMIGAKSNDAAMANKGASTNQDAATAASNSDSMEKEEGVMVGGAMMTPDKDIVDNAVNSKDHTTLVAAVTAAGLGETLKGQGPFTVFAPTNAAFAKLPAGTVDTLVMPENKAKLTSILTYHVVPGRYTSTDITEGMTLKTVQGQELTFTMKDGKWWINESAMIEIADAMSSNGVTHVIDTVLMPTM